MSLPKPTLAHHLRTRNAQADAAIAASRAGGGAP